MIDAVVFDVGETLVDETREYGTWADWLGVPKHGAHQRASIRAWPSACQDRRCPKSPDRKSSKQSTCWKKAPVHGSCRG